RWRRRTPTESDAALLLLDVDHMGAAIGLRAPLVAPDREASCLSAGLVDPGAGDLFHELKLTPCFVRDSEMGEVQVSESPARGILGRRLVRDGSPEERKLIAESPAVGGAQMAGVVPPFGLEVVVRAMIEREAIGVTGNSRAKSSRRGRLNGSCLKGK